MTTTATTTATPASTAAKAEAKATDDDVPMTASASSSDSDSESSDDGDNPWLLGFVEPPISSLSLLRHHFRSKVGGRPAWLDPCSLPTPSQLCCGATGAPLDFLCQVYAPLDESESDDDDEVIVKKVKNKHEDAFHRAIFVFVGPSGSALADSNSLTAGNRSVRAFRCQLPRNNPHYSPVPAPGSGIGCAPPRLVDPSAVTNHDRWRVAECEASIVAAAAEAAAGVGGGSAGGGAQVAAAEAEAAASAAAATFASSSGGGGGAPGRGRIPAAARLFPEAELVVEEEGSDCGSDLEEAMERAKKATAVEAAAPKTPAQGKVDDDDADENAEEQADVEMMDSIEAAIHPDAVAMARFSARVARAPSQVLRYRFDRRRRRNRSKKTSSSKNSAIWPRAHPRPPLDSETPPCPNCGAPRALEFQILPQMLNFLGCDAEDERAPDWSCVGVWSCVESCSVSTEPKTTTLNNADAPLTPLSKTGGAGISGGPSAYLEEFVWVQPSDAQQQQQR